MKLVGFRNWWWGGAKFRLSKSILKRVGQGMEQFRIWSRKIITFWEKEWGRVGGLVKKSTQI